MRLRHLWFLFLPLAFALMLATGCESARGGRQPASDASARERKPGGDREERSEADAQRLAKAHALFIEALQHDLNGEAATAIEKLDAAFHLDPNDPLLALDLARRYERTTNFNRAAEVLKLAAARNASSEHLFVRLAGIYSVQGEVNLALQAAEGGIKADPGSLLGYQSLYVLRLRGGQTNEAWEVLDRASGALRASAESLTDLAELFTSFGRQVPIRAAECKKRSVQLIDRAAGLDLTNRMVVLRIADGYYLFDELPKAMPLYEQLLEDRTFPEEFRDSLRAKLTAIYIQTGQRDKAAAQLRAILADNPLNVQAHLQLSHLAMDEKKFAEAADHMKQVVTLRPEVEGVYYDLARLQLDADDAQESLKTLDRARTRFSQNFWGEYLAAIAFTRLKEYSNALMHFTAAEVIAGATDTNRLTHQFYFQLGAARERNGDFKGAETSFLKCLELSPDFASALNYLGYMWADRSENLDRAREMIERALKQEPENEAYVDSMAWVLFRQDKTAEALEWMLKAIKLSSEPDAEILDHLGEIYAKLGQVDKAIEAWKKSLAADPKDSVRKKLEAAEGK